MNTTQHTAKPAAPAYLWRVTFADQNATHDVRATSATKAVALAFGKQFGSVGPRGGAKVVARVIQGPLAMMGHQFVGTVGA